MVCGWLPQGVWLCPRCTSRQARAALDGSSGKAGGLGDALQLLAHGGEGGPRFGAPSSGEEAAYRLAARLGSVEYT